MLRVVQIAERVALGGAWLGGALLVASVLAITVEILCRALFGFSFSAVDELTGYALAIASAWAFGYALINRIHIRIDTVYVLLPQRLRVAMDVVALVGMIAFFGALAWFGTALLARSLTIGQRAMTPLRTPIAVPQLFWLAGIFAFVAIAVILLLRTLQLVARRDIAGAAAVAGSRSAQEELDEELRAAEERRRMDGA